MERTTDKMVRPHLRAYLSKYYDNAYLYEELAIKGGTSIADMALFTESEVIGIEIKSGKDNLRRLETQIPSYDAAFSRVYIVVDDNHLERVEKTVPYHWGIFLAYDGGDGIIIELHRDAGDNPNQRKRWLLDFFWRDETTFLLKKYGIYKGMSSKNLAQRYRVLGGELDTDTITKELFRILPARQNWKESRLELGEFMGEAL